MDVTYPAQKLLWLCKNRDGESHLSEVRELLEGLPEDIRPRVMSLKDEVTHSIVDISGHSL